MNNQYEKAEKFRRAHAGTKILVLPNAWDVATARLFESCGFTAVATSSAAVAVSYGYRDGQGLPLQDLVQTVERICSSVSLPVSVDIVAGYGANTREIEDSVTRIVGAGAVGVNIEDFEHSTGRLFDGDEQAGKIEALRSLAGRVGVPFVINARTDALRYHPGNRSEKFKEALRRAERYRDSGADCVYPMGLTGEEEISKFVASISFPINVMVSKNTPTVQRLESLGVRRLSFGPSAAYAAYGLLRRASAEILEKGTFSLLTQDALTYDELNKLGYR
ncbi:MAG: isocitrate lyase/phosphoenolpyruvate mutase family protein [Thermoprotei archaeon]